MLVENYITDQNTVCVFLLLIGIVHCISAGTNLRYITLLTSLTSPTSKFLVSGPAPLPSAAGPLTGVHGVEIVPAVNTLPPKKRKTKINKITITSFI